MRDDDLPDWLRNHTSVVPSIFVPKYYREGSHGSGLTPSKGNGTVPWNSNGSGVSGNGDNPHSDNVFGSDRDTAPGIVEVLQLILMPMKSMSMIIWL